MAEWCKELGIAVTVIDTDGKIVVMNDKSREVFQKYGGGQLIGQSVYNCHSPASREKLADLIANNKTNVYAIEKNGVKKLMYQTPWYRDGEIGGIVELSMEIPAEMPHFTRK